MRGGRIQRAIAAPVPHGTRSLPPLEAKQREVKMAFNMECKMEFKMEFRMEFKRPLNSEACEVAHKLMPSMRAQGA